MSRRRFEHRYDSNTGVKRTNASLREVAGTERMSSRSRFCAHCGKLIHMGTPNWSENHGKHHLHPECGTDV